MAISSDTPVVGRFASSDEMLNKLHGNIYWTQRANFIDMPTDCPQRDERLGWTGDAQVYVRTATLNTDVEAFFTKWLVDLDDGQRADGQFPMVAPVKVANDDGGPAWADAGVICPWTIYEVYGDRRILEQHYPAMKRFVDFCAKRSTPELLPPAQYHAFGDWLSIGADTPREIIYTAYFAQSTRLLARAAEVLGQAEDAAKYRAQYDQIKQSFNKAYVAEDGRIRGDTQTCYVLALAFDLLDEAKAAQAAAHLVADIEKHDWHLSTGFIGTKDLMLVLAKIGRNDVAYRLIHNDTFPSWGFSIKQGATSIWERWDGWTPEKGFQDAGMNSFAHYSFGAVYQWMVENIGGIRSDGAGLSKAGHRAAAGWQVDLGQCRLRQRSWPDRKPLEARRRQIFARRDHSGECHGHGDDSGRRRPGGHRRRPTGWKGRRSEVCASRAKPGRRRGRSRERITSRCRRDRRAMMEQSAWCAAETIGRCGKLGPAATIGLTNGHSFARVPERGGKVRQEDSLQRFVLPRR